VCRGDTGQATRLTSTQRTASAIAGCPTPWCPTPSRWTNRWGPVARCGEPRPSQESIMDEDNRTWLEMAREALEDDDEGT
jgi:hypothetical protein